MIRVVSGLFFILALTSLPVCSQVSMRGASDIGQLRWWIGIRTGFTFTKVRVLEKYAVTDQSDDKEKEYQPFLKNAGQTIGAIFGFAFTPNLLVTFQPSYSNYKYRYHTSSKWSGTEGSFYTMEAKHSHRLGYVEFPLLLRLMFQAGRVEPFVHFGGYYGKFTGGRKKISFNETISENGYLQSVENQTETVNINDQLMKSQWGLAGGVGLSYTIQYFRLGLELGYKTGQFNITDVKKRYSNSHLISRFFDIPDNMKWSHFDLTVNLFMPVDNLIHLHSSQKTKGGKRK